MRRAFTLIEMMIALAIGAIMLTGIMALLSGVWLVAKESGEEVQFALHARAVRERLFYNLKDGYGLITAPAISIDRKELVATLHQDDSGKKITYSSAESGEEVIDAALDKDPASSFASEATDPYRTIFLKVRNGENEQKRGFVAYRDRVVVPLFGKTLTTEQLLDAFQVQ